MIKTLNKQKSREDAKKTFSAADASDYSDEIPIEFCISIRAASASVVHGFFCKWFRANNLHGDQGYSKQIKAICVCSLKSII